MEKEYYIKKWSECHMNLKFWTMRCSRCWCGWWLDCSICWCRSILNFTQFDSVKYGKIYAYSVSTTIEFYLISLPKKRYPCSASTARWASSSFCITTKPYIKVLLSLSLLLIRVLRTYPNLENKSYKSYSLQKKDKSPTKTSMDELTRFEGDEEFSGIEWEVLPTMHAKWLL